MADRTRIEAGFLARAGWQELGVLTAVTAAITLYFFINAWKRLPVGISRAIGPWLARGLA